MSKYVKIAIILVSLLSIGGITYYVFDSKRESKNTTSNNSNNSVDSVKTINDNVTNFKVYSKGNCKGLAPENWNIITNSNGTGVDLASNDNQIHTGWWMLPINKSFYGNDVEATIKKILAYSKIELEFTTEPEKKEDDFIFRNIKLRQGSVTNIGHIMYKTYPNSSGYVLSAYFADTRENLWQDKGALAAQVAGSIRCKVDLKKKPNGQVSTGQVADLSSDPTYSGVDASTVENDISSNSPDVYERWREGFLNYENVYSPSTGENYQVSTDYYNESGPEGPGYYSEINSTIGSYERLETGYSDY